MPHDTDLTFDILNIFQNYLKPKFITIWGTPIFFIKKNIKKESIITKNHWNIARNPPIKQEYTLKN